MGRFASTLGARDMALLCHRLATLHGSGVPLARGLKTLEEGRGNKRLREVALRVRESIEGGATFGEAVRDEQPYLPPLFTHLVGIGERSGGLAGVLSRLASYYDDMRDLYHRVIRQVAYPAAVLMAILVGIPILRAFLADVAGVAEAPFDVQLYRILRDVGLRMGGTLAVLIVLSRLLFRFTTRESVLIYCWPFAGIIRTLILSRFAWAMAEFTRAGLPLDQAVRHAGAATGARRMAHDFATLAPRLREGYTLTEALAASRYLSPTAQTYIRTGEVAGELDTAFEHLYRALYDTALFRLRVLIILIGPLAILGLGALTVAAHL